MAYGLDGIVDGGCQGRVSGGAFGPAGVGGERGGQGAGGELHGAVLAHSDQRGPFRLGQLGLGVGAAGAAQQGDGGAGGEGGEQQGAAGLGGGPGEEPTGHLAGLSGDGQGVGVVGAAVAGLGGFGEGVAEGEGEARVAAAGLVDPAGEAGREAVADEEFGDLVGAQRGYPDGGDAGAAEGFAHRDPALDAFGDQDPDAGRGEAQGEAEQVGALGVEPLGVVEDEQDGVAVGEGTQHFDHGEAQGDVVAAGPGASASRRRRAMAVRWGPESCSRAPPGTEARRAAADASGIHWSAASGARHSTVSWRDSAAAATARTTSVLPAPAGPVRSARPCAVSARSTALISSPCPTLVSACPVAATTHSHQPLGPQLRRPSCERRQYEVEWRADTDCDAEISRVPGKPVGPADTRCISRSAGSLWSVLSGRQAELAPDQKVRFQESILPVSPPALSLTRSFQVPFATSEEAFTV